MRAPGMSINRVPILIWGTLTASAGQPPRRAGRQSRLLPALDGPPVRHAFLRCRQRRPAAALAAPVLDVRPSLGLCDRAAGDGHGVRRRCRSSAAARWSATRPSRSRPSRPWRSASASGCTTCSPPACRAWRCPSSAARPSSSPSRARLRVFAWIATIWTGRPVITTRLPVLRQHDRAVRHRRRLRLHDRLGPRSTGSSPTPISSSPTSTMC